MTNPKSAHEAPKTQGTDHFAQQSAQPDSVCSWCILAAIHLLGWKTREIGTFANGYGASLTFDSIPSV
jgi:hypothetical protein